MNAKPVIVTNRPVATPIEIGIDACQRACIRATARNIVRARTPCTSLTQYLNTASERGLDRLCGLVSQKLRGNETFDPTDIRAVLLQMKES